MDGHVHLHVDPAHCTCEVPVYSRILNVLTCGRIMLVSVVYLWEVKLGLPVILPYYWH